MGKASAAKKVTRAARAGGPTSAREPRSLLFPASLVIAVLPGVSLVVYARSERRAAYLAAFPQLGDHIPTTPRAILCGWSSGPLTECATLLRLPTHIDRSIHLRTQSDSYAHIPTAH